MFFPLTGHRFFPCAEDFAKMQREDEERARRKREEKAKGTDQQQVGGIRSASWMGKNAASH